MRGPFGAWLALCLYVLACVGDISIFSPVAEGPGAAIEAEVQEEVFRVVGRVPEQLATSDWLEDEGGERYERVYEHRGVIYRRVPDRLVDQVIDGLAELTDDPRYSAYKTNLELERASPDRDFDSKAFWDLAIVYDYSEYELLEIHEVSGVNYGITNQQVIDQIRAWSEHMELAFDTFESDRFAAKIRATDYDLGRLAAENYELCPDVIDQGYDSMEELIEGLSEPGVLWCWWD